MKKTGWITQNSLVLVSIGLMLSSSGLDGAYLSRLMYPPFGYLLNTISDIAGMVIMYWFGRLQQDRSSRKRKLSYILLPSEIVSVAYAWFFGWRQLLIVLPEVEGSESKWIAVIAAGFIPLLLAACGYAQALLSGGYDVPKEKIQVSEAKEVKVEVLQSKKERVEFMLRNNGTHTTAEIAEFAGCSPAFVRQMRRRNETR
jgi:hypothetical protein